MTAPVLTENASLESLVAQVVDEFLERQRRGEKPDPTEYANRHPHAAGALREVLAALQVVGLSSAADLASGSGAAEGPVAGLLGDYRILQEVGRGGMGVVYEAEQISLSRRVALKVLPFAAAMDGKQLQRFKNEAQAAAQLHHTNIVPVHAVGCERGVHFYAMQFIEGLTLAAVIRDLQQLDKPDAPAGAPASLAGELASGRWAPAKPNRGDPRPTIAQTREPGLAPTLPAEAPTAPVAALSTERSTRSAAFFRTVANLGIEAAEALEHAHQSGVIHRDIKPGNLMVDPGGRLWVTDFGLARLGSDAGLTMTGDLLGTLRYMSPEQALAKRVVIDHRTDVYSLGVTFYELLTLEPAYSGRSREEVLRQIAFEEPLAPRQLNRAVPAELETIVLKAMAKNPEERYATAQELADDLKRFLEDKPIKAKRPSLRQRAVKWTRRHKTVVRAALVGFLLAVTALAVSTALIWQKNQELSQTLERELQLLDRERRNGYFQTIALAEREWSANNLGRMQQLLDNCPEDLRGWEWHYLNRLRYKNLVPLRHEAAVFCAVFSPDGRRVASCDQDGWIKVWDVQTGRERLKFRAHQEHARSVAFSPDGRRLATASYDGTVKTWDAQTGQELPVGKRNDGLVRSAQFSPDGQYLASALATVAAQGVNVWDAATGDDVRTLGGLSVHAGGVRGIAFSPDGRRLAASCAPPIGGSDVVVTVWDLQTGRKQLTICQDHVANGIAFSADGRLLAAAMGEISKQAAGEIKIWDAQTGQELLRLRGHTEAVYGVAFSPDGGRLASASLDHTVKLWDVQTGQEVLTLRGHHEGVCAVAFSPDGHRLISAGHDRTVRVWDATPAAGQLDPGCLTLRGHGAIVNVVAFYPKDRRLVASAGSDGSVRLWDAHSGEQLRTLSDPASLVRGLAFSPDGRRLAAAAQKSVTIWDTATWQKVAPSPLVITFALRTLAFSPDGRRLAAGGFSHQPLTIWDATTGELIRELPNDLVTDGLAFSPDGRWIAAANLDGTVRVWDLATGKEVVSPPLRHEAGATGVSFSPDGQRLASASLDGTVTVWDTASWRPLLVRSDSTGGVRCVTFSPDGGHLAWGGTDATVKVADATTGQILQTLRGHTGWVQSVAFSPDGRRIASASSDGTVKIWDVPAAAEAAPKPGE